MVCNSRAITSGHSNLANRYLMNPGLLSLSLLGHGGGEAPVWSTHCGRARMGGWLFSSDPASPHSCYVSGLVFLWCELSRSLSNHTVILLPTVYSLRVGRSKEERSESWWSHIACLPPQEEILLLAFKECHNVLTQCNNQPFHRESTDNYMCKHIIHVCPYKVSQEPVSIHLPISRLLAGRGTNIWDSQWFVGIFLLQWTYFFLLCDL